MTAIPIFFTIDDNFPSYLDCALRSMMRNASQNFDYKFVILHEGLSEEHIAQISSVIEPPFSIEFRQMERDFAGIQDREGNRLRCDFFTVSIFFRLFIADLFPQYDKCIYLDSDVVVPGDISELYNLDLGGNILGACPDFSVQRVPEFAEYIETADGIPLQSYVNSGVLLMDLKKMRELRFSEHFLHLMNTYQFKSVAPDQDYINAMCLGKILFLDECWDAMPPMNWDKPELADPKIIHFNLFWKPWCYDNIPYEKYFWEYARDSQFYQEILDYKAAYSDEKKSADQATLQLMLTNALAFMKEDVTFRKVHESKGGIRLC